MRIYESWEELEEVEAKLKKLLMFCPGGDNRELIDLLRLRYEHSIKELSGEVSIVALLEDEEIKAARKLKTTGELARELFEGPFAKLAKASQKELRKTEQKKRDFRRQLSQIARRPRKKGPRAKAVYSVALWAASRRKNAEDLWRHLDPKVPDPRTLYVSIETDQVPVTDDMPSNYDFIVERKVTADGKDVIEQLEERTGDKKAISHSTLRTYFMHARKRLTKNQLTA